MIFQRFCESNDYRLNGEAEMKLNDRFSDALTGGGRSFGNGRYARNLFEQVIRNQALRLWSVKEALTKSMLTEIMPPDILTAEQ